MNRKKGDDREGRKEMELRQRAKLQKRSVNFSLFLCEMEEICVYHWMCKLSYLYISSHGALSQRAKSCWNVLQHTGRGLLFSGKEGREGWCVHLQMSLTGWERQAEE